MKRRGITAGVKGSPETKCLCGFHVSTKTMVDKCWRDVSGLNEVNPFPTTEDLVLVGYEAMLGQK